MILIDLSKLGENMLSIFSKTSIFILIIMLPLITGGLIYFLWRPDSLLMFVWIDYVGLTNSLMFLRESFQHYQLPSGILYNLPNGTWTYAFTAMMTYIWLGSTSSRKILFILLPLSLGFAFEYGQYINIIPGTYCYGDVLAHLFGAIMGYIVIKLLIIRRIINVF